MDFFDNCNSAVPRRIFIPLNRYGRPKNELKFLKTSPIFFDFNQFNNCPFFLPNYFITLFSCLSVCLPNGALSNTFAKVTVLVHASVCPKNSGYGTV